MPKRLPVLLAAPPVHETPWLIWNARVFDSATATIRAGMTIRIRDGKIVTVDDGRPADSELASAVALDAGGRTVLPGLIDAHAHLNPEMPQPAEGVEPIRDATRDHLLAASLRSALALGVTTLRDVGSYGDAVLDARQAVRYGAFDSPRILTCGRIISATAPGGRFFDGMYAQADGADGMRRAVREQIRRGADFVKIMSTGARSVELEDPEPAQVTEAEMQAVVDEAHRLGYRVASHSEGLAGTELAIRSGVDTIEHGMYLHSRPDLLDLMATNGQVLVPTFGCFYGVAGIEDAIGTSGGEVADATKEWTPLLRDLALYNLDQADVTLKAAKSAGVIIAAGHDWYPFDGLAMEICRLHHHGLTGAEALQAATRSSALGLGLHDHVGNVAPGLLADLTIVDGDPVADPGVLRERADIWLVVQGGRPVEGERLRTRLPAG